MNEILQQRIESVQAGKNITHAQIEAKRSLREQLDSDLEAFLKNGGKVETLPRGYSGLSDELKPTQKMRSIMSASVAQARALSNNPSVIAWREAKEKGLKYIYLGSLQRPTDSYKLQFKGMEWFDGEKWQVDISPLKEILK